MRIIYKKPVLWPVISFFFPAIEWDKIVMTFGHRIYTAKELRQDIIEHEKVHMKQQTRWLFIAFIMVTIYFISKRFRLKMEVPAYRAQYQYLITHTDDPEKKALALFNMANQLSSPIYGSMVSLQEAKRLICES